MLHEVFHHCRLNMWMGRYRQKAFVRQSSKEGACESHELVGLIRTDLVMNEHR